jgi:hypothetical protein
MASDSKPVSTSHIISTQSKRQRSDRTRTAPPADPFAMSATQLNKTELHATSSYVVAILRAGVLDWMREQKEFIGMPTEEKKKDLFEALSKPPTQISSSSSSSVSTQPQPVQELNTEYTPSQLDYQFE